MLEVVKEGKLPDVSRADGHEVMEDRPSFDPVDLHSLPKFSV